MALNHRYRLSDDLSDNTLTSFLFYNIVGSTALSGILALTSCFAPGPETLLALGFQQPIGEAAGLAPVGVANARPPPGGGHARRAPPLGARRGLLLFRQLGFFHQQHVYTSNTSTGQVCTSDIIVVKWLVYGRDNMSPANVKHPKQRASI